RRGILACPFASWPRCNTSVPSLARMRRHSWLWTCMTECNTIEECAHVAVPPRHRRTGMGRRKRSARRTAHRCVAHRRNDRGGDVLRLPKYVRTSSRTIALSRPYPERDVFGGRYPRADRRPTGGMATRHRMARNRDPEETIPRGKETE